MEELAEDTLYFLLKSGLQDRIQFSTVLYCTLLHCTVLYYTVLYCTGLQDRIQFDHQANANKQTDHSEERWDFAK